MASKQHILDNIPFDEEVMQKAKKYMVPYEGVPIIWWIFWFIACMPVLVLVVMIHMDKLSYAKKRNDYAYFCIYTGTPFVPPTKEPSKEWGLLFAIALIWFGYYLTH